jgi:hypothetical protein
MENKAGACSRRLWDRAFSKVMCITGVSRDGKAALVATAFERGSALDP